MNYLLLTCALLATAAPAGARPAPAPPTKVAVFFTRQTTFTQLAAIRQDLLKDNLALEYDQLEFDKSGHLLKISFHVDCDGTTWGSATEDHLTNYYTFGFVRDYTAKTFKIGNLK